ncbi:hypothetical protein DSLASN_28260 [Desulfoluna limicola]|uniref:Uncharacterized protein n=1 Tax=Desulfoluna limicola TaxID=2810562 RepID=A0ABN6F8U3_9BACT|nr:hypothetical protein DSLASN_28260 [Desulfoluna limicola]
MLALAGGAGSGRGEVDEPLWERRGGGKITWRGSGQGGKGTCDLSFISINQRDNNRHDVAGTRMKKRQGND